VACVDTAAALPLPLLFLSTLLLLLASSSLLLLPLPLPLPVAARTSLALTVCETRFEVPALRESSSLKEGAGWTRLGGGDRLVRLSGVSGTIERFGEGKGLLVLGPNDKAPFESLMRANRSVVSTVASSSDGSKKQPNSSTLTHAVPFAVSS
jgi:hypothetical protein